MTPALSKDPSTLKRGIGGRLAAILDSEIITNLQNLKHY